MGADARRHADDVRRLLSLNPTAAWVEEAREIDPAVFAGIIGRVSRFPSEVAGGRRIRA